MDSFLPNSVPSSPSSDDTDVEVLEDSPFQIRRDQSYRIISIEGNIGSGKSTLLNHMKEALKGHADVIFLKEPVDEWEAIRDAEGRTMLQKFYADQDRYSFAFQMMAYISRLALLKEAIKEHPHATFITERSLFTDRMVFAKMLYDQKHIEDVTYQIYLKWFDCFTEECQLTRVVYVKTDPDLCHHRIGKRSRIGESSIPLAYLKDCHDYHEKMLDETSSICICKDQLIINGNVDIFETKDALQNMIELVKSFIL